MEQLKATLTRKVGPFSVGVWILILAAGITIAFLIRKRFGPDETTGDPDSSGTANVGEPADGSVVPLGGLSQVGGAPITIGSSVGATREMVEIRDLFSRIEDMFDIVSDPVPVRVPDINPDDPGITPDPNDPVIGDWIGIGGSNVPGDIPPGYRIHPDDPYRLEPIPTSDDPVVVHPVVVDERTPVGGGDDDPGDGINPPAPTGTVYVVKSGDWLSKIAGNYPGVSWQQIYEANRAVIGSNPDLIHPGMRLVIPTT